MSGHDEIPYIIIERERGGLMPFVWGALIGAGVTLLYSPRSGREVQRELVAGFDRLRHAAEERVDEARDAVADAVDRTREKLHDQIGSVRESIEDRTSEARTAMDEGRREAARARSDLEARVAAAKTESYETARGTGEPEPGEARVRAEVVVTDVTPETDPEEERID